jgi:hypothetical protein
MAFQQGVEDIKGLIMIEPSNGAESTNGDIITRNYGDFELRVDFKLTKGANSGVVFCRSNQPKPDVHAPHLVEFQLMNDEVHPDAKWEKMAVASWIFV